MIKSALSWALSFLTGWHPDIASVSLGVDYCLDLNRRSSHHVDVDVQLIRLHCTSVVESLSRHPWVSDYPPLIVVNDMFPFTMLREPPIASIANYLQLRDHVQTIIAESACSTINCVVMALNTHVWRISTPPIIYGPGSEIGINSYGVDETAATSSASCTGLSIFLATSLRIAGIPARIAGVPNWKLPRNVCPKGDLSPDCGNHNWVEVFVPHYGWSFVDQRPVDLTVLPLNASHFYPKKTRYNSISFQGNHSIYAASYLNPNDLIRVGYPPGDGVEVATHYPMPWDWEDHDVFAWDVSAAYKPAKAPPLRPMQVDEL